MACASIQSVWLGSPIRKSSLAIRKDWPLRRGSDRSSFMTEVNLGIKSCQASWSLSIVRTLIMRLTQMLPWISKALPAIRKKLKQVLNYFVGGSVRDAILHRPIHDVDIWNFFLSRGDQADFSANSRYWNRHGTVLVLDGDEVWGNHLSDRGCLCGLSQAVWFLYCALKDALWHRLFTVNAFALVRDRPEIIDLFHGLESLENPVLRGSWVAEWAF